MLNLISSFNFYLGATCQVDKLGAIWKVKRLEDHYNKQSNININDFSRKRLCFKLLDDNLSAKSIDGLVDQLYYM